jgi:hypothetical protein
LLKLINSTKWSNKKWKPETIGLNFIV